MTADTTDMQTTIALVQESWSKVKPIASEAACLFYQNLFVLDPQLRQLFKGDMREQGARLMQMLDLAVAKLSDLEALVPVLQQLGRRHHDYGVKPVHYDLVGIALLQTLEQGLRHDFSPDKRAAWTAVYDLVAKTMIDASDKQAAERAA